MNGPEASPKNIVMNIVEMMLDEIYARNWESERKSAATWGRMSRNHWSK
jgi:hypothetical protein